MLIITLIMNQIKTLRAPASEAWIEDGGTWLGLTKPSVYLDKFTTDPNLISAELDGIQH